jgi:type II secretory pathway component PulF
MFFAVVFITAAAVVDFLVIFVVPSFRAVFDSFGPHLPLLSGIMLNTCVFIQKFFYIFIPLEIIIILAVLKGARSIKSVKTFKIVTTVLMVALAVLLIALALGMFMPVIAFGDVS